MKNKLLSVFIAMAMLFTQLSAITVHAYASLPINAGTTILRPIDATYISQHGSDSDTNYYGESVMKINNTSHNSGTNDYGQYGYMKFDISSIAKERIASAKLKVYVENAGDKSSSKRTIGIYDTCDKDWDGTTLTWSNNPYPYAKTQLGTFEVNANGSSITDAGWREIDITDYVRDHVENEFSFMIKMLTWPAYNVVLSSGTYTGAPSNFDSSVYNKRMPQIVIDYCAASSSPYSTTTLSPSRDTYVDQHNSSSMFFYDEYMQINFTDNESRSDRYGSYAYMDFDISDVDKETLSTAKLWVYVSANSDTRNSTRTIGIFEPASKWNDYMTWWGGRVSSKGDAIATYTVTGNGYDIVDYGWKCVDITDYVKDISSGTLSLMMKSISSNAHPVLVHSSDIGNKNTIPKLVINNYIAGSISTVYNNNQIDISGYLKEANNDGIIRIFDAENNIIAIDNVYSDSNNYYSYSLELDDNHIQGTYQIILSERGSDIVYNDTVDIDCKSNIFKIKTNNAVNINESMSNINISLSVSNGFTYLIASTIVDDVDVNDMLFVGIYNNDGTLYDYTTSSIATWDQGTQDLKTQITLPEDINNYYVKVYICDGGDAYIGSMIPKTNIYTITGDDINNALNADKSNTLDSKATRTFENIEVIESEQLNFVQDDFEIVQNDIETEQLLSLPVNMPGVEADVIIMNNGFCTERILVDKSNIALDYVITNNSTEDIDILPILASYDEDGAFRNDKIDMSMGTLKQGVKSGSVRLGFSLKPYDTSELTVKGFLWNNFSSIRPYIEPIVLNNENQDFYGDSFATATRFPLGKCEGAKGYIDSSDDIDILKIETDSTGEYEFKISSDNDFKVTVYNESYQEIASYNFVDTESFIVNLIRDNTYYLGIESNDGNTGEYLLCESDIYIGNYKRIEVLQWGAYIIPNTALLLDSGYYLIKEKSADEGYAKLILSPGKYYIYDPKGTGTLTKDEINSLETNRSMNGVLTSENDFNMYSYIPVTDTVYNFSGRGECQITATIYDAVGTVIGSSDNSENLNYSVLLEASKTYYVKVAPKSASSGVYTLTLSEQAYEDNIIIAKNQIQVCIPYGRDATISLYNASNSLIKTKKVESSDNIISYGFDLSNMQSEYKLQVRDQNKTVAVFNISIITSTQQFAITPKSYPTVSVFATNVADLSDIYFSVNFDSSKTSLYDPCEQTYDVVETTPQFISSASIDILDIRKNMVLFKSSKTADDIINTIKLKSETSGVAEVTIYTYKVQQ